MLVDDVKKISPLDRVVYWMKEREAVRLKKEAGKPKPWTDDEILRSWRFCNVRRMDDKVSRWLTDNWYTPYRDHPNMMAAIALARFVNRPESLGSCTHYLFQPGGNGKPAWESVKKELRVQKANGRTVFNGAYMVRGNSTKSPDKIGTVVDEYIGALVARNVDVNRASMEYTHTQITDCYGFGSFMAGQVVADLRWAVSGEWADRDTWAPVGPGSAKGLAVTLHPDDRVKRAARYLSSAGYFLTDLRNLRREAEKRLPTSITGRLEMHDWQNVCCEIFKYNKVLFGEGRAKQTYPGGR